MTRLRTDIRSCRVSQVERMRSWVTEERQATNGTKLRLKRPSTRSVLSSRVAPTPISTVSSTSRTTPVLEEHADAFEIEDAERDQVAGMHAVVEAEAQALQLVVTGETKLVTDMVPDRFPEVVLQHGEEAAEDTDGEQHQCGRHQSRLGLRRRVRLRP